MNESEPEFQSNLSDSSIHNILDRIDQHGIKGSDNPQRKSVIAQMIQDEWILVSWDGLMGPPFYNGWCVKPPDTTLFECLWHVGLIPPPESHESL